MTRVTGGAGGLAGVGAARLMGGAGGLAGVGTARVTGGAGWLPEDAMGARLPGGGAAGRCGPSVAPSGPDARSEGACPRAGGALRGEDTTGGAASGAVAGRGAADVAGGGGGRVGEVEAQAKKPGAQRTARAESRGRMGVLVGERGAGYPSDGRMGV